MQRGRRSSGRSPFASGCCRADHLDVAGSRRPQLAAAAHGRLRLSAGARARAQIQEQRLGPQHPARPGPHQPGRQPPQRRRRRDGRALVDRALTIREQALGPTHPAVAGALNAKAYLLYMSGDYARRPLYERALAIREAAGPNTARSRRCSTTTACCCSSAATDGARRAYERAIGSPSKPSARAASFGRVAQQPGGAPAPDGRLRAGARPSSARWRSGSVLGPDHPECRSPSSWAPCSRRRGLGRGAARLQRAIRIRERAFGPDNLTVAGPSTRWPCSIAHGRYPEARRRTSGRSRSARPPCPRAHRGDLEPQQPRGAPAVMGDYDAALPPTSGPCRWPVACRPRSTVARHVWPRANVRAARTIQGRWRSTASPWPRSRAWRQFGDDAAQPVPGGRQPPAGVRRLTRVLLELHGRDASWATIATPGRCSKPGRGVWSPTPWPPPVRPCPTPRPARRPSRSRPRGSSCAAWRRRYARSRRPARRRRARSGSRTSRRSWPRRRRSTSRRRTPSWRAIRSTRHSSSISRPWTPRRWRSSPTGCHPGRWPSSTSPRPTRSTSSSSRPAAASRCAAGRSRKRTSTSW